MSRRIVVACAAAAIALVGLACFFGERGGENQFSPFTLERRGRERLYIAGVPIYRSGWSYYQDCLTEFLVAAEYWTPVEAADPRWISMSSFRGRSPGDTPLDFALNRDWVVWSARHPDLASRLWPYVLKLLRGPPLRYDGLGVVDPETVVVGLFIKVRRAKNLSDLERELKLFAELTAPVGEEGADGGAAGGKVH
jgi:hypothetical protein